MTDVCVACNSPTDPADGGGGTSARHGRSGLSVQEKVKCSVCKKNDKAVVITRCFHCFCESCVKTRLETRQRKCPACAETFGNNDVQKIYLAS